MTPSGAYSVRPPSAEGPDDWQLIGPDDQPVQEVNRFLHTVGLRGLRPGSLRAYAYDLLCALRWMHGIDRRAHELGAEDLLDFIEYQRHPRPPADTTINHRLGVLQRFILFLRPTGAEASTRSRRLRRGSRTSAVRVRTPSRLVTPLTDPEALRFFRSLRTARDRAITLLLWADGLRCCEVLNLGLEDVDFPHMSLKIRGKGRKERMMPLTEPVAKALRYYLAFERPVRAAPSFFVVLKGPRRGQPMTYPGMHRIFRYHRTRSQVLNANAHRFRHTFGANMTRCRVSLVVLAKMMGHSSPQTTLRYIQLNDLELRHQYEEALHALNRSGMLNDPCPPTTP